MPKQNPRKLNPNLRNNGSGYPEDEDQIKSSSVVGDGGASLIMKALKRAQEQAAREGRNVKEVSGAGKNRTLAACSKRPRTVDKYSAFISSIPSEIMHHILSLLPASVLQEIVRFVCKEWNAIITNPLFIRAHLLQSLSSPATTGFLI
ncbi:uncharacterized protein LOC110731788 [Chenopodium quinoa]|uniref:uncharacterized protein LOC110731788 n=1 Tax=Chenopodium quinoa TaxID=63459 RepID=UPI000B77A65B|nr:uncharacterized protein LOC110731788 [Chenopodium quinoa]